MWGPEKYKWKVEDLSKLVCHNVNLPIVEFGFEEDKEVFSIIMSDDEGREELKKSLADKLDEGGMTRAYRPVLVYREGV